MGMVTWWIEAYEGLGDFSPGSFFIYSHSRRFAATSSQYHVYTTRGGKVLSVMTFQHIFYFQDHPDLAERLHTTMTSIVEEQSPFEDVSLFYPSSSDMVQMSHSFRLFCASFSRTVHSEHPLDTYEDMPETYQLRERLKNYPFDDDYIDDRVILYSIHE